MSMLQNSLIVFHQILVMFLLMLVGYLIFRREILDKPHDGPPVHAAQHHRHALLCALIVQPGF